MWLMIAVGWAPNDHWETWRWSNGTVQFQVDESLCGNLRRVWERSWMDSDTTCRILHETIDRAFAHWQENSESIRFADWIADQLLLGVADIAKGISGATSVAARDRRHFPQSARKIGEKM